MTPKYWHRNFIDHLYRTYASYVATATSILPLIAARCCPNECCIPSDEYSCTLIRCTASALLRYVGCLGRSVGPGRCVGGPRVLCCRRKRGCGSQGGLVLLKMWVTLLGLPPVACKCTKTWRRMSGGGKGIRPVVAFPCFLGAWLGGLYDGQATCACKCVDWCGHARCTGGSGARLCEA